MPTVKADIITHVTSDSVLVSFDDGPRPELTPRLLDTLAKFNASACFFVIGKRGAEHRQLLKRIVAEGHELGNHTWNHIRMMKASKSRIAYEIQMSQALIEETTGKPAQFFRPPYGKMHTDTVQMVQEEFNLTTMLWSIDPSDWSNPGVNVIQSRVSQTIQGGDILLLHERRQTAEALSAILSTLRDRNLKTISAPIKSPPIVPAFNRVP